MFKVLLSTMLLRPPGGGKGPGARGGKVRTSSGGRKRSSGGSAYENAVAHRMGYVQGLGPKGQTTWHTSSGQRVSPSKVKRAVASKMQPNIRASMERAQALGLKTTPTKSGGYKTSNVGTVHRVQGQGAPLKKSSSKSRGKKR